MGERAGIKPDELFSQYRVTIARDYLTRSKRAGKAENVKTLADFIRDSGGISAKDEHLQGELRDRFSIKEGYNLINNKSGKTLDLLAEAAWEAGYFSERPTPAEFLDALGEDVDARTSDTGQAVFARQDIDAAMEAQLDEEYKRYLEAQGEEFEQGTPDDAQLDAAFAKVVADVWTGKRGKRDGRLKDIPINVMATPDILRALGVKANKVTITERVIEKSKAGEGHHPLPVEVLEKLPSLIRDPLVVFDSATIKGAFVFLTRTEYKGKSIIIAIHPDVKEGRAEVNRIASVHDKEIGEIRGFLKRGLLRYWDEEKAKGWLQSHGLQPFEPMPAEETTPSTSNILSKQNLVKYKQAARGRITFKPEGTFISLLKDADKSTFLHESAHLYFRVLSDLSKVEGAKSIRADLKTVLNWLKVDSVEKMEVIPCTIRITPRPLRSGPTTVGQRRPGARRHDRCSVLGLEARQTPFLGLAGGNYGYAGRGPSAASEVRTPRLQQVQDSPVGRTFPS